jgi:hypothetical protein
LVVQIPSERQYLSKDLQIFFDGGGEFPAVFLSYFSILNKWDGNDTIGLDIMRGTKYTCNMKSSDEKRWRRKVDEPEHGV